MQHEVKIFKITKPMAGENGGELDRGIVMADTPHRAIRDYLKQRGIKFAELVRVSAKDMIEHQDDRFWWTDYYKKALKVSCEESDGTISIVTYLIMG